MSTTQVVWPANIDPAVLNAVKTKGLEESSQQSQPPSDSTDPVTGQLTVFRYWITESDALAWIAYVEQYNPISAGIVN